MCPVTTPAFSHPRAKAPALWRWTPACMPWRLPCQRRRRYRPRGPRRRSRSSSGRSSPHQSLSSSGRCSRRSSPHQSLLPSGGSSRHQSLPPSGRSSRRSPRHPNLLHSGRSSSRSPRHLNLLHSGRSSSRSPRHPNLLHSGSPHPSLPPSGRYQSPSPVGRSSRRSPRRPNLLHSGSPHPSLASSGGGCRRSSQHRSLQPIGKESGQLCSRCHRCSSRSRGSRRCASLQPNRLRLHLHPRRPRRPIPGLHHRPRLPRQTPSRRHPLRRRRADRRGWAASRR